MSKWLMQIHLCIYTSRPFQGYKEHLNVRYFDPCNHVLNYQESRRTPKSHFRECERRPHTSLKVGLRQCECHLQKWHNPRIPFQINGIHTFLIWCKVQPLKTSPKLYIHGVHGPPFFWENEDVIDGIDYKIIQVFMKDIIHQMLENKKCTNKAKWHHNILKMVITGSKRHLPFIAFSNVHQVVCST
jgi:hypothetical protein